MKFYSLLYTSIITYLLLTIVYTNSGCAQIGIPTGGPKDTIPPILNNANPANKSTNFTGSKITLTFNEYIQTKDVAANVLISPYQKQAAEINYKLKTVTVKLKDSLLPNTTYTINFGNAIIDLNEGNPFSNFRYVFSTGKTIDSLTLSGKVVLAETGTVDSTLIAMLYRNAVDSTIKKRKPDYIAKINSSGFFTFENLPKDNFKLYALKDGDGGKTYNSKTELFAFSNKDFSTANKNDSIILYAFAEEKEKKAIQANTDKRLRYTTSITDAQDLLTPLTLTFNKPLKKALVNQLQLTDTSLKPLPNATFSLDSTTKIITLNYTFKPDEKYRIIIDKGFFADSTGLALLKTDTLRFKAKKETDYGNVTIRFKNLDVKKNKVLQFLQNGEVKKALPITATEWNDKLFTPGEYELNILYDDNKNKKWDTGNYSKKIQPEIVIPLQQKLSVKASWDNELDINL